MKYLKTAGLDRRALLSRIGTAALALPALQLFHRKSWGQPNAQPGHAKNFLIITTPNGIDPLQFWPTGGERDFVLSPNLEPLKAHRDKLLIVGPQFGSPSSRQPVNGSGLRFNKVPGIHRAWVATTGHSANAPRVPQTGDGLTVRTNHPSVDQLIANKLTTKTRYRSLEFGVHPVGGDVPSIINFAMDGSPMPRMANDKAAFDRVFGGVMPTVPTTPGTPPTVDLSGKRRAAVSEFLGGRFATLNRTLGREDRQLLESHLSSLREVEGRLGGGSAPPSANCDIARAKAAFKPATVVDASNPTSDAPALAANMQDMAALAFACDLTRVASISMSWEGGGSTGGLVHTWLGSRIAHHGMSHHGGNADKRTKYNLVTRWYAGIVARLLDQLKLYPHPDGGTLYDQTLVWWMFRHGDGNAHANFGVPGILAGGAGGYFGSMGRFLSLPATDFARFPLSMVNAMGLQVDAFGIAENRVTAALPALRA